METLIQPVFTIKNKNSIMKVFENGVLHIIYFKNVLIEVDDIKDVKDGYNSLAKPKPMKVIVKLESGVSISLEARKCAAEHSPILTGVAYIIEGLAQRLLVKFYIRMWKIKKPVKIFNSLKTFNSFDEASDWLNSI
jgi:hypothetical protein